MVRHIERPLAIYITWLLLHTSVTAHQVTTFAILTALTAAIFMSQGDPARFFIGACILQFWYLLDHVDGQIARYRKKQSIDGLFFDFVMHHLVSLMVLFAVGWAVYSQTLDPRWILVGYMAATSSAMIGILSDCRSKAVYAYLLRRDTPICVRADPTRPGKVADDASRDPIRRLFALLHKSCEGHVIMNALTFCALAHLLTVEGVDGSIPLRIVLIYYACIATLVWVAKLIYIVAWGRLSEDFKHTFTDA